MQSELYPGEQIRDEDTTLIVPDGMARGLTLHLRTTGYGAMSGAPPFPNQLLIPRHEWQARIEEMEQQKTNLSSIIIAAGLPPKNQQQTNYCWANAPVHCVEILRVVENQPTVILSPASVAAPIKHFQNEGGWGEEALQYIIDHGCVPVAQWPANAINTLYNTPEARLLAMHYRVTGWWELVPQNEDQFMSCLLRRIPIASGYNRMSHEMTAIDPVYRNGRFAHRVRNSWGDIPDWPNGMGIMSYLPDDAVAPRYTTAS